MSVFGKLFGSSGKTAPDPTATPATSQAGHTISYDPVLMDTLLHDHTQLTVCYAHIGKLLQENKFGEIRGELINFKTRLQAHILSENVRFYTYLEQSLEGDRGNLETLHDFRREMNVIARGVMDFVRKYQTSAALSNQSRLDFTNDYSAVGKLLAQRLQREESSLYPLYQPR